MEENIRKTLTQYRDCTLQIIDILEKDDFESLEELIQKRQQVVDEVTKTTCMKEEMKLIYEELRLQQLQEKLKELMFKKIALAKDQFKEIAKKKTANNVYNRTGYIGANIFSFKR